MALMSWLARWAWVVGVSSLPELAELVVFADVSVRQKHTLLTQKAVCC